MKKKVAFGAIALGLVLVLSLAGAEVILRLIPNQFLDQYRLYKTHGVTTTTLTVRHADAELVGYRYLPGQAGIGKVSSCFVNNRISINKSGFNDREWPDDGRPAIGVLGDSTVAAIEVPSGESVTSLMRELSGVEVFNASINGYQPPQMLDTYRTILSRYKPRLTVLFLYLGNDIHKTFCRFQSTPSCVGFGADGGSELRHAAFTVAGHAYQRPEGMVWRVGKRLGQYFVLVHFVQQMLARWEENRGNPVSRPYHLFNPSAPPEWEQAWSAFAWVLSEIKSAVESDGGRLAVVAVPMHEMVSEDWRRELELQYWGVDAGRLDRDLPRTRLMALTEKMGLPFIDPVPFMRDYARRHKLSSPYYSFRCDGHWNPLAHYLMANLILSGLTEKNLLQLDPDLLKRLGRNLARSPGDILGSELEAQIYGRGAIYTGNTKVRR